MTTTIGAGIGGFCVVAPEATYGASPNYATPRTLGTFKSAKATYRPHPVQGGPYLRNGQFVDIGSARELIWLDAMMTITGDVASTGMGLLLAAALGTSASVTQIGTTTAYELGGASGASIGLPDVNNTFVDVQLGVPTTDATLHAENYHSGIVTKAEWVFERGNLVTYSYDLDFQYLEKTYPLLTPSEPAAPVPFDMALASSFFKMGTLGSEAAVDGVRKCTITLERKLSLERIYLGNVYKDLPVSNDNAKITVGLEMDYTTAAKTAIFDLMLAGTPTSIICEAVGAAIGSSGQNQTFALNVTNAFLDTGGESTPDGPDLVKNTASFSGTYNTSGASPMTATLITADTGW